MWTSWQSTNKEQSVVSVSCMGQLEKHRMEGERWIKRLGQRRIIHHYILLWFFVFNMHSSCSEPWLRHSFIYISGTNRLIALWTWIRAGPNSLTQKHERSTDGCAVETDFHSVVRLGLYNRRIVRREGEGTSVVCSDQGNGRLGLEWGSWWRWRQTNDGWLLSTVEPVFQQCHVTWQLENERDDVELWRYRYNERDRKTE